MNQPPTPGPRPGPGPRPTPGPRPFPGPAPTPVVPTDVVDPDTIRQQVAALLEQADGVTISPGDAAGGDALVQLAKQAHLLEQAHTVITDALEKVDRA